MGSKVFISCGQKYKEELNIANKLKVWLISRGFEPYIAVSTQSIEDINSGILGNLKKSDYYIFIDFPRELIKGKKIHRGSLFTHQELAIAYYIGFENVLFLKHENTKLEGLLKYIGGNAIPFNDKSKILSIVKEEIKKREWKNTYTRHLIPKNLNWNNPVSYRDHVGNTYQACRALTIDIFNNNDIAAYDTIAKLKFIYFKGLKELCWDRSFLKVTGQPGFNQIIWPKDHGAFDLLLQDLNNPINIYLNSSLDLLGKKPVINETGEYLLYYQVISRNIPMTEFKVKIEVNRSTDNTLVELII